MTFERIQTYQPNWSWNRHTERWLSSMCLGKTLNFPCGQSKIGDVRADIDKSVNPDIIADLKQPLKTFKRLEFDTVICDPPFSMYNKHKWYIQLQDLAKKRIIYATPMFRVYLPKGLWKKSYFITEQNGNFFIRLWQIFDRKIDSFEVKKE